MRPRNITRSIASVGTPMTPDASDTQDAYRGNCSLLVAASRLFFLSFSRILLCLSVTDCGSRPMVIRTKRNAIRDINRRIHGGSNATYGMYPWQARIHLKGHGHWCGGIIIGEYWILTAAHCFYDGLDIVLFIYEKGVIIFLYSFTSKINSYLNIPILTMSQEPKCLICNILVSSLL